MSDAMRPRSQLRFLTCGSVDDGKSTLMGRLVAEAGGLLDDQAAALAADSSRFGTTGEDLDYALLLDGLEIEREQGITIDVAYRFFATPRRAFIVADTPGHQRYTRNMATGASTCDLAVLLVDARKGMLEQTRRHAAIVSLLGIQHVVLAVNKMDLVAFSETRFAEIAQAFGELSRGLSFSEVQPIPVSALGGDNVVRRSGRMPWYGGPCLLEHLEGVEVEPPAADNPLRFPVQWINRPDSSFRGLSGTVASGEVSVGDEIVVARSGETASVRRIVTFDGDLPSGRAGEAVTLTLSEELDIARGDLLVHPRHRPIVTRRLAADLIWMAQAPVTVGASYLLKVGTATVPATIATVEDVLDLETLARAPAKSLALNGIGRVRIETVQPMTFDPYVENRHTGAFILIDRQSCETVAAGLAVTSLDKATHVHRQAEAVSPAMRAAAKGQVPLVVWLTGLPGSGKSTIANIVERRLLDLGYQTMLLDGDNLRQGLNADLGFDAAARAENVRRVGEVARLMAEAGLVVLVALVSPFRADRERAAGLLPDGRFLEVFVDTPLEVCRQRDPKGLYASAGQGRALNVTGHSQPYEPPLAPGVHLATVDLTPEATAEILLKEVTRRIQS